MVKLVEMVIGDDGCRRSNILIKYHLDSSCVKAFDNLTLIIPMMKIKSMRKLIQMKKIIQMKKFIPMIKTIPKEVS